MASVCGNSLKALETISLYLSTSTTSSSANETMSAEARNNVLFRFNPTSLSAKLNYLTEYPFHSNCPIELLLH